jgi:phosphopantothenoylcysteine decarboxylase/phosphopantothenate--cysteine ligase
MSLRGKHIVLGVTGGIAAYKIPLLVRLLKKAGAEVRVTMTESAKDFVTPLTLSAVSENPVVSGFTDDETWNNHVEWARWADLILIAPLTANTLAKLSAGQADTFLTAVVMSAENIPVLLSPAMDREMYRYPAVKEHLEKLKSYGFKIIEPESGELLSGLTGTGRMPEPESLFEHIGLALERNGLLKGKKVLITGGPTYEPIDPVRFIGNRSSGKTGVALAEAAVNEGASVTLISGPSKVLPGKADYEIIPVETAEEMFEEVKKRFSDYDILIMSAAVSDYKPLHPADSKIKKDNERLSIELVKNPDILAFVGRHKQKGQVVVGFALETDNPLENAKQKLKRKKADMIVLNSPDKSGKTGFDSDTNKVVFVKAGGEIKETSLKSKKEIAKEIIYEIAHLF